MGKLVYNFDGNINFCDGLRTQSIDDIKNFINQNILSK